MNNKNYTGTFFGLDFKDHVYEPTKEMVDYFKKEFPLKYKVGQKVKARRYHEKTYTGKITRAFYGTSACFPRCAKDGGTIRGYYVDEKLYFQEEIKSIVRR